MKLSKSTKTFRLFISSTFSDLVEERNALQREVFPRIKKLCEERGCNFQAIDLRWGVKEEASLDQRTMKICLNELKRCQKVSPRPSFLVLLGDRYGWRPLPSEILSEEFESISKKLNRSDRDFLFDWYKCDDNSLPPIYCLKPRGDSYIDSKKWEIVEKKLREILLHAVAQLPLSPEQLLKYRTSATHQEILHGALKVEDAQKHVFCFFRSIKDISNNAISSTFIDKADGGVVDDNSQKNLADLKKSLRQKLPGNIHEFSNVSWISKKSGITLNHISEYCDKVYQSLKRVILEEIKDLDVSDELSQEIALHNTFGKDRSNNFVGRKNIQRSIVDYLNSEDNHPFCIYGPPGSGKSALLGHSLQEIRKNKTDAKIVARFIGATPGSSSINDLLTRLCQEISRQYNEYNTEETALPFEYTKLVEEFIKRLSLATAERPLILFLDAIDQLTDFVGNMDKLQWLPFKLPTHVHLVVSVVQPSESLTAIKNILPKYNLIKLEPMPANEGELLLNKWLVDADRKLQPNQKRLILENFAFSGSPLYLKLAFERTRKWKSYDKLEALPEDVHGIIKDLFFSLSQEHGDLMVSRTLGYIRMAKNGLAEDEIIDLLSEDQEVYENFINKAHHEPPEQNIPVVIWSRLYSDLQPYLTTRYGDGTFLINFFHKQFFKVVDELSILTEVKQKLHQHLAKFFLKQSSFNAKIPNIRKCAELPFQLSFAQMWPELESVLTSLEFMEAKCSAGMTYGLADDYQQVLSLVNISNPEILQNIKEFSRFFQSESHILRQYPELTFQQAINQPDDSIIHTVANKMLDSKPKQILFSQKNKIIQSIDSVTLFNKELYIVSCAWHQEEQQIITGSPYGVLTKWDSITGEILMIKKTHSDVITFCCFSPLSNNLLLTASRDGFFKLFNSTSLELIYSSGKYDCEFIHCSWSNDGKFFALTDNRGNLFVFDSKTREKKWKKQAHQYEARACRWSYTGLYILTCSDSDRMVVVWDGQTGKKISDKNTSGRVLNCEWIDESNISYVTKHKDICIWNFKADKTYTMQGGHEGSVSALSFNPKTNQLATGSDDRSIRIWSIDPFEIVRIIPNHLEKVTKCYWSPKGTRIAVLCTNGSITIWKKDFALKDVKSISYKKNFSSSGKSISYIPKFKITKKLDPFHKSKVSDCALSCDGKLAVTVSDDRQIKVWKTANNKVIKTIEHDDDVHSCTWSPDGFTIAVVDFSYKLNIYEAKTGLYINKNDNNNMTVFCKWSPDGLWIASLCFNQSNDAYIAIWDVTEGKNKVEIPLGNIHLQWNNLPRRFDWFPDGKKILVVQLNQIAIIAIEDHSISNIISGNFENTTDCKISPNGQSFFNICDGISTIYNLYNTHDENKVIIEEKDREDIYCAWLPDGKSVAVINNSDTMLHIFSATNGKRIHSYYASTILSALALGSMNQVLIGGTDGNVFFLEYDKLIIDHPLRTPVKRLIAKPRSNKKYVEEVESVFCHWCGTNIQIFDINCDLLTCPSCKKESKLVVL